MRGLKLVAVWVVLLTFVIVIPAAMAAEDWATKICWKTSYELGSTTDPSCDQKYEMVGKLCYMLCKPGFKAVELQCWQICPEGYIDEGKTCRRDFVVFSKKMYGRGVGKVPHSCPPYYTYGYGTCTLTSCKPFYKAIGSKCWQVCGVSTSVRGITMPADCGKSCSSSQKACAAWRRALSEQRFQSLADTLDKFDPKFEPDFSKARKLYPVHISDCQMVIPHKSIPLPR